MNVSLFYGVTAPLAGAAGVGARPHFARAIGDPIW